MYQTYNDLVTEIEIYETRLQSYKEEIEHLKKLAKLDGPAGMKGIDYSNTPVQSTSQIKFKDYLDRVGEIENHIFLHEERLKKLCNEKSKIDELLKELKGTKNKIGLSTLFQTTFLRLFSRY